MFKNFGFFNQFFFFQGLVLLSLAMGEDVDESNLEIPAHFPSSFQDFLNKLVMLLISSSIGCLI